ncbi:MAG: hypothetical protein RBT76_06020 [candidate division Zixibacteria bacterium]|jgi:hypothetical protein|nr:hypothetical protein [candidate division Zixibacteria bacterium]
MSRFTKAIQEIKRVIGAELESMGFVWKNQTLHLELSDRVEGSVRIRHAVYDGEHVIAVFVVIGVRNDVVEDIVSRWWPPAEDSSGSYRKPSASIPLGYLMTENAWKEWHLSIDEPVAPIAREIGRRIIEYGIPWMEGLIDLRSLLRWLKRNGDFQEYACYAVPAIHLLLGERAAARQHVQEVLSEVTRRGPDYFWSGYSKYWPQNYRKVMTSI